MKTILSITLIFCSVFYIPLVEGNDKTEKKEAEEQEENKLLTAEEFSKAFSKPTFKNTLDSEKEKVDNTLPYVVDGLGDSPFDNDEYKSVEIPQGSLAASIKQQHKYSWQPKWQFTGKGGILIPAVAISKDLSMMAILENVPHENGKTGTMIVLINTYTWTVSRIHYFKDLLFTKIFFCPGRKQILVWEESQNDKLLRKILLINAGSGKIIAASRDINDPLAAIAMDPAGNNIFLKTLNDFKSLYVFEIEDITKKPAKRNCFANEGSIAVSENSLAFAGKEKIVFYKLDNNQKIFEMENKSGDIPENISFLGDGEKLAFSSYMKPLTISVGRKSKQISDMTGKVIFYRKDLDMLAFEEYKNRQITFFSIPKMETVAELVPAKIKPKTVAGALFLTYLPHMERYVVLDTQGTLCLYHKPGRKWRKKVIFSAKK